MTRPWHVVDRARSSHGELELRRRGEPRDRDFLLLVNGRVLMNSRAQRSERALAEIACATIADRPEPRLLLGGLGMGITARAALALLPSGARVEIAELEPAVVRWCRGPLAEVSDHALADPRVEVVVADVSERIEAAGTGERLDAIVLDLLEGPHAATDARFDPLYGRRALERAWRALAPGGVLAVWGEDPDPGFEARLRSAGFDVARRRPGRGGRRHVVYCAKRPGDALATHSATTRRRPAP